MKVLLINPPWYRLLGSSFDLMPLGLSYLAAALRANNHRVIIYNADHTKGAKFVHSVSALTSRFPSYKGILMDLSDPIWQEIKDKILYYSPELIGISVKTPTFRSSLNIAKSIKEVDPTIQIVLGGPHPTILPQATVEQNVIDFVVRGEGEYTLLELVNAIDEGNDIGEVLGLTYKKKDRVIHNPDRPLIKNLDELPFPARDLLVDREIYSPDAFGSLFSSRGCPYRCTFCESHKIWTRNVRFRSPENVVAEMQQVRERYDTRKFDFEDDTFSIDKKRVMKFCKLVIQEKLDIVWSCTTRANLIDDDMLKAMRKAGCFSISIGVESGSEETLRKIKKGVSVAQVREASRLIKKHGISLSAYWMFGFPWETKADIEKTISFMRELDADSNIYSIVTPYPGSELFETVTKDGLVTGLACEDFFHQSPEMMLSRKLSVEERRQVIIETERIVDSLNREKSERLIRRRCELAHLARLFIQKGYYKRPSFVMPHLWNRARQLLDFKRNKKNT